MADAQITIVDGDPTQIAVIDGDPAQVVMAPVEVPAIVTAVPGPQGPAGAVAAAIDGSAALPSIAFASDTDTGLYRVGANQLGVSTGGTQRLVIDANGQIEATSLGTAAAPTWTFVGDPNTGIYSPGADQLALATNGTGRLFIDANGDITSNTSPSTGLSVRLYGTATGTNVDAPTSRGVNLFLHQTSNTNNNTSAILFVNALTNTGAYIAGQYTSHTNRQTALVFGTGDNAAPVERFRITSAGLVGVGTSAPDRLLHLSAADTAYLRLENQDSTGSVDQYVGLIEFEGQDTGGSGVRAQVGAIYEGVSGATALTFGTSADAGSVTERLRINRNGNVGIGTTSPAGNLHILSASGANTLYLSGGSTNNNNGGTAQLTAAGPSAGWHNLNIRTWETLFTTDGTERARIDSSGRLLVGTSSARSNFYNTTAATRLQIEGTNFEGSSAALIRNSNDNSSSAFVFAKSRGTSTGSNTVTQSGDFLGEFAFQGNDGSEFVAAAAIAAVVDGTPGADDMPGRLVFSTTADGAATPTERLRITSAGLVGIGTTTPGALLDVTASAPELRISSSNAAQTSGSSVGKLSFYTPDATTPGGAGVAAFIETTSVTSNGSDYQLVISKREGSGGGSCFINLGASSSGAISFGTNTSGNGTERARIDSSGRLLVGTSSDAGGALLQVNGNRVRIATAKTPSSASDTGTAGEICWDASYIYVCTATNTWKRTAIATW